MTTHCFVVPTFGESRHLAACLESLAAQTRRSPIIVSTSTPFDGLDGLAASHGATVVRHAHAAGIGADWNAALSVVRADWVTIAHQDDVYSPSYVESMLRAVSDAPQALLAMSFGREIRGPSAARLTPLMAIKRLLTEIAFVGRRRIDGRRAKRRLLVFGNPVVCPSVMLNRGRLQDFRFREDLQSNLDWCAWLSLAVRSGAFVLVRENLVDHRTHADGETSRVISQGVRDVEDAAVFSMIWPAPIARTLACAYRSAYLNRRSLE